MFGAVSRADVAGVVEHVNALENAVHNGGNVLNKFHLDASHMDEYTSGYRVTNGRMPVMGAAAMAFAVLEVSGVGSFTDEESAYIRDRLGQQVSLLSDGDDDEVDYEFATRALDRVDSLQSSSKRIFERFAGIRAYNSVDYADFAFLMSLATVDKELYTGRRLSPSKFLKHDVECQGRASCFDHAIRTEMSLANRCANGKPSKKNTYV